MGIATFEIESKFEMAEQSEYEFWLDYVESEGWSSRMIEDENETMMRNEVMNILNNEPQAELDVSREKI